MLTPGTVVEVTGIQDSKSFKNHRAIVINTENEGYNLYFYKITNGHNLCGAINCKDGWWVRWNTLSFTITPLNECDWKTYSEVTNVN